MSGRQGCNRPPCCPDAARPAPAISCLWARSAPAASASRMHSMTGRWILSAPNAPSCGLAFGGAPGARDGTVPPMAAAREIFTRAGAGRSKTAPSRSPAMRTNRWRNSRSPAPASKVNPRRHAGHTGTLDALTTGSPHAGISALLFRAVRQRLSCGADAQPDRRRLGAGLGRFLWAGVQRHREYRTDVNEMGEVPVLVHGKKKLTQSGVILTYLAETHRQVQAGGRRRASSRRCAGSFSTIRRSTAFSVRSVF